MGKDLFTIGKEVLAILKANKYEAYFVGGCVRDYLLKKQVKDIDITTEARPEQVSALFQSVIPIGIDHGTVLVRYKNQSFEITTYRTESTYSDQRHPDTVEYITSIEEDLKRRDFTINALAMDENKIIIDLFNGKEDLNHRILRAVGSPRERFLEDPLRMIRALRFSAQLGFSIENDTFNEMIQLKDQIEHVAQERITEEISRLFSSSYVKKGIYYLKESGIYKSLPIFKNNHSLIHKIPETLVALSNFSEIVALFHLLDRKISITTWIKEWKGSNESKRNAKILVESFDKYIDLGLHPLAIYPLPSSLFESLTKLIKILGKHSLSLDELRDFHDNLPIQNPQELALNGSDIMKLFPKRKPGRWIKELMDEITEKVLIGELANDKTKLREWIICHSQGKRLID